MSRIFYFFIGSGRYFILGVALQALIAALVCVSASGAAICACNTGWGLVSLYVYRLIIAY